MKRLALNSRDREIIYEHAFKASLPHQELVALLLDFVESRDELDDLNRFVAKRLSPRFNLNPDCEKPE